MNPQYYYNRLFRRSSLVALLFAHLTLGNAVVAAHAYMNQSAEWLAALIASTVLALFYTVTNAARAGYYLRRARVEDEYEARKSASYTYPIQ